MSDTAQIITTAINTIGIILVAFFSYLGLRKAGTIHKQLNSMRDQENETNRKLGREEGKATERAKHD